MMQRHKSCLEKLAPKKFCFHFELKVCCKFVGIILAIVMAASTIATVIQTMGLEQCESCAYKSWKHAYGYSVSTCIYCCLMFLVNLWFIWGVCKEKKSVVLAWVMISAVWLVQTACLLIVLIIEYSENVTETAWIISLVFTIIAILLLVYFLMAGYGYWLQLRDRISAPENLKIRAPENLKTPKMKK